MKRSIKLLVTLLLFTTSVWAQWKKSPPDSSATWFVTTGSVGMPKMIDTMQVYFEELLIDGSMIWSKWRSGYKISGWPVAWNNNDTSLRGIFLYSNKKRVFNKVVNYVVR